MCYNCGCGDPNDDMGKGNAAADPNGRSLTNKSFKALAQAEGMSVDQAKKEVYKMLKKEIGEKN